FVALRKDGALGSGTASDPYDGSTAYGTEHLCTLTVGAEYSISLARNGTLGVIATISPTPANFPFAANEYVNIAGETSGRYNGQFQVTPTGVDTFTFNLFSIPDVNPINGSAVCRSAHMTVDTVDPHGFAAHDIVEIQGVEDAGASQFLSSNGGA
ncbi:MAG TPA: hypothetical protein VFJ52_09735, partial [Terriglobia bacterium]|nr:hypothetical protein [Terriglobia bacterium]